MTQKFDKGGTEHFDINCVELRRCHERVVGLYQIFVIRKRKAEFEQRNIIAQVTIYAKHTGP